MGNLVGFLTAQACDDLLLRGNRDTRFAPKLRQTAAPLERSKLHLAKSCCRLRMVLAHLSEWGVIRCDESSHHSDDFLFGRVQRSIRRLSGHRSTRSPVGGGRSLRRHLLETVSKGEDAVKLMPSGTCSGMKQTIPATYPDPRYVRHAPAAQRKPTVLSASVGIFGRRAATRTVCAASRYDPPRTTRSRPCDGPRTDEGAVR